MNTDLIKKYDMLPEGARVLCAVSGGADSVYLLHRLLELSGSGRITLGCAHFDHCLRGEESTRDARFVRELAERLNIPFFTDAGDVAGFAEKNRLGIEETARRLRYDFLETTAREHGYDRTATAHTADDNAETMLLNLARGSGLRGLCGIPPRRGELIRPILDTTREEIERWLAERDIAYVEDSTNAADNYARNRVRRHAVPALRGINPRFAENALRAGELMRADEEFLESLAARFLDEHAPGYTPGKARLPVSELLSLPLPVAARALRAAGGRELSSVHVEAVLRLCRSENPFALLDLPGLRAGREYGELVFGLTERSGFREIVLKPGLTAPIPELGLEVSCRVVEACHEINESFNIFFFKIDGICGNISVRPRAGGDKMRISGRGLTKTLKKLFSEARIPAGERERIPVVADDSGVLAVCGFGVSERVRAKPGKPAIELTFTQTENPSFEEFISEKDTLHRPQAMD